MRHRWAFPHDATEQHIDTVTSGHKSFRINTRSKTLLHRHHRQSTTFSLYYFCLLRMVTDAHMELHSRLLFTPLWLRCVADRPALQPRSHMIRLRLDLFQMLKVSTVTALLGEGHWKRTFERTNLCTVFFICRAVAKGFTKSTFINAYYKMMVAMDINKRIYLIFTCWPETQHRGIN